jgi:hypothetical protein
MPHFLTGNDEVSSSFFFTTVIDWRKTLPDLMKNMHCTPSEFIVFPKSYLQTQNNPLIEIQDPKVGS